MRIVDTFHFNNETEVLDLRTQILKDSVDEFVIKEATTTFRGDDKPLLPVVPEKARTHLVTFPRGMTAWERDTFQKSALVNGIDDDDVVMMSDVDEIPDMSVVESLVNRLENGVTFLLSQAMFVGYLNVRVTNCPWFGTRVCNGWTYKNSSEPRTIMIGHGGWHWSFIGGACEISRKLRSYAHDENDNPTTHDQISERLERGEDVIDRGLRTEVVAIDETFPAYIRDHVVELSHLIKT
jgi:beta-1,4-mannosyl-glycoprotein beta-1,4-N-acetylglucosaminyltransferase